MPPKTMPVQDFWSYYRTWVVENEAKKHEIEIVNCGGGFYLEGQVLKYDKKRRRQGY